MAVPDLVTLSALIEDAKCFALVRQHRWPEGVHCPACGSGTVVRDVEPLHKDLTPVWRIEPYEATPRALQAARCIMLVRRYPGHDRSAWAGGIEVELTPQRIKNIRRRIPVLSGSLFINGVISWFGLPLGIDGCR